MVASPSGVFAVSRPRVRTSLTEAIFRGPPSHSTTFPKRALPSASDSREGVTAGPGAAVAGGAWAARRRPRAREKGGGREQR